MNQNSDSEPDICDADVQGDSRCSFIQSNIRELRGRSRSHDDLTWADMYWGLYVQIPSELQPPLASCWTCQEEDSRKALQADVNARVNEPSQQGELEGGVSWGMSWGNPIMHLSEKLNASMWWDKHWLRNGGFFFKTTSRKHCWCRKLITLINDMETKGGGQDSRTFSRTFSNPLSFYKLCVWNKTVG